MCSLMFRRSTRKFYRLVQIYRNRTIPFLLFRYKIKRSRDKRSRKKKRIRRLGNIWHRQIRETFWKSSWRSDTTAPTDFSQSGRGKFY